MGAAAGRREGPAVRAASACPVVGGSAATAYGSAQDKSAVAGVERLLQPERAGRPAVSRSSIPAEPAASRRPLGGSPRGEGRTRLGGSEKVGFFVEGYCYYCAGDTEGKHQPPQRQPGPRA